MSRQQPPLGGANCFSTRLVVQVCYSAFALKCPELGRITSPRVRHMQDFGIQTANLITKQPAIFGLKTAYDVSLTRDLTLDLILDF